MAEAVVEDDAKRALTTAPAGADRSGPEDGSDEIERLRGEIALRRRRIDSALQQLEHRVSEDLDWRRRVAAHPWLVLTAAALAGFALGRFVGGRPPSGGPREIEVR